MADNKGGQFQVLAFPEGQASNGHVQNYKRRKLHHKSHSGCLICKRRRIKCDEHTPACQNCIKHGTSCIYGTQSWPQLRADQHRLRTRIHLNWYPDIDSRLFTYFIESVVKTMMPLSIWEPAVKNVVCIAVEEPLAMHSVLAASGCHYRYHRKSPRARCLSETYHAMRACSGLRQWLEAQKLDKVDAAITTSMFLGCISFADMDDDFQVSLQHRQTPFSWLGSQLGLGPILTLFQSKSGVDRSMWISTLEPVVEALLIPHPDDHGQQPGGAHGGGVPAALATIFEVFSFSSSSTNHPYLQTLRRLCRLVAIDPEDELALLQYVQFVEGISSQFLHLLNSLDTRALLLASYWLALLCAKDCWWTRARALNDCRAICEHIEQAADKSLWWKYMDFPAAACGYPYTCDDPAGQRLVEGLRSAGGGGGQLALSPLYPSCQQQDQ